MDPTNREPNQCRNCRKLRRYQGNSTLGIFRPTGRCPRIVFIMTNIKDFAVVDKSGLEVHLPKLLTSFRGEKYLVLGISKVPGYGSGGKVAARIDAETEIEFYPTVFGLSIVPRSSL